MPSQKEQLRLEIDSYKDTVWLILAFIHEMIWDDQAKVIRKDVLHEHGSQQVVPPDSVLTPDVALILGKALGCVGEAKLSFARRPEGRDKIRDQLLKYDALVSHWTAPPAPFQPRISEGCVVMLTHHTRKVEAQDYLVEEKDAGRFRMANAFAIVSGVRTSQRAEFLTLERSFGRIVPPNKDDKLRRTVAVPLEHILKNYGAIKFYDADPPLAYLLEVLWDSVFPNMIPEENFRRDKGAPTKIEFDVNVEDLAKALRDSFSMRLLNPTLPECPKRSLVEEAMRHLESFKLAQAAATNSYRVQYRRLKGGALEYFLQKLAPEPGRKRPPKGSERQLDLIASEPTRRDIVRHDNDEDTQKD